MTHAIASIVFGLTMGLACAFPFVRAQLEAGRPVLGLLRVAQFWLVISMVLLVDLGVDAVVH